MKQLLLTVSVCALTVIGANAAQINVGYRETKGINVGAGETATQTDAVRVTAKGDLLKIGKGTLTMPVKAVDQNVDSTVKVLEGTLELTAGEGNASAFAPSVITKDAALWIDITGNGTVITNGVGETADVQYLARWCDVREENTANPTMYYFDPTWLNHSNSVLWGVAPEVTTAMGRSTVYFGGGGSSQCMRLKKNGSKINLDNVYDYFVVFGVTNSLGHVIGALSDPWCPMFNTAYPYAWDAVKGYNAICYRLTHCGISTTEGRNYLDGELFNPYSHGIKRGFQLLESHSPQAKCRVDYLMNGYAESETVLVDKETHKHEGGDYISELIVFTRPLNEDERVVVERYLMAKWGLPHHYYGHDYFGSTDTYTGPYDLMQMQTNFTTVATSTNGTLVVNTDDGEVTKAIRLSGEGKVIKRGKGAMEIGPSGSIPFNGEFKLEEGTVRLRGGLPPALDLTAGQRLTSAEKRFSDAAANTAEGQREAMTEISLATDAEANAVVKDGAGPARVRSIASGVRRLRVNKGQLVIDPGVKQRSLRATGTASAISAEIPNSGFEGYFIHDRQSSGVHYYNLGKINTTSSLGWTGGGNYLTASTDTNGVNKYSTWCGFAPPEGTNVLCLIGTGDAYTTVRFPVDGYYQMSVYASDRGNSQKFICDVYLGESSKTKKVIGTIAAGKNPLDRFFCKTPFVKAGQDYVFGFAARYSGDTAINLDDVRLDFISGEERLPTAYAIPNGDFEQTDEVCSYSSMSNGNKVTGWTLNGSWVKGHYTVGRVTPATFLNDYNRAFTGSDVQWSSGQLLIAGKGSAETTFTPPAGTYRVRGRAASWPGNFYGKNFSSYGAELAVSVTIGGATTSLGNSTTITHELGEQIWPTSFTVDGSQAVTLKVEQKAGDAYMVIVDDFDLVAGDDWSDVELLKDTETDNVNQKWFGLNPQAPKYWDIQGGIFKPYGGNEGGQVREYYWGYNRFIGDRYLLVAENGGIGQSVTIPVPGTYRVTYHERSRLGMSCGGNPISVWMRNEAGDYTNFIARSTRYFATNYVEYAYTFQLPSAGKYTLAFQGNGYNRSYQKEDLEEMIDGVSLRYVPDEAIETPSLPEDLMVYVEKGAILCLNFPGTVTTGPVKLGGVTVTGEVSAKTYPEYITGNGKLDARAELGDGFLIIVR